MTPDEHAARAEALLANPTIYTGHVERGLQAAQVHATLSLRAPRAAKKTTTRKSTTTKKEKDS